MAKRKMRKSKGNRKMFRVVYKFTYRKEMAIWTG